MSDTVDKIKALEEVAQEIEDLIKKHEARGEEITRWEKALAMTMDEVRRVRADNEHALLRLHTMADFYYKLLGKYRELVNDE